MAVIVTVSLSVRHFAGSEYGQRILPHFLRPRRGGQLGAQVLQAAGVVGGQQKRQIVAALDALTAPSALHPVSDQGEYVALHAAESRMVDLAWRIGLRDLNSAIIWIKIYVLQNLYDLSDEGTVAEVIDSRAFSDFCGADSSNQVPNGDTLGRFRNLLIQHGLQDQLLTQVVVMLMERGLILKKGTIVDSTIFSALSSTKNKVKKRDPDAHQTKKGNTWHFGYKAHIGVDRDSGLVHTVKATAVNVHDVSMTSELLHEEEETVNGDSGYVGAEKREDANVRNNKGKKIRYQINRRPSHIKKLSKSGQYKARKREHAKSSVRAKVEHVFSVVKGLLKFKKTRYRGLRKQAAKFNIMFALANLILADRPCLAA